MIKDIIGGVVGKLAGEFGDDIVIYTEDVKRKEGALDSKSPLRRPNFFVSCKNPSSRRVKDRYFTSTQLLGNRYLQRAALCVECRWLDDWRETLERLFACLEYVPVGGDTVVRGDSMQGEYVGDVLYFFVSYDVFVFMSEETEIMEKMEVESWH